MRAITVQPPFSWAIGYADKPVENRDWPPSRSLCGQDVAVHAGARDYPGAADILVEIAEDHAVAPIGLVLPPSVAATLAEDERELVRAGHVVHSAVVAVTTLAGWVKGDGAGYLAPNVRISDNKGGVLTPAEVFDRALRSGWFCGEYGHILVNRRPLIQPVRCKGALGYWTLPPDVEACIRAQLANPGQPVMQCPQCRALLPDFDGVGMVAHTNPPYADGCGYCSHPSRDGDGHGNWTCGICGDVKVEAAHVA